MFWIYVNLLFVWIIIYFYIGIIVKWRGGGRKERFKLLIEVDLLLVKNE